ncbi:phospholipase D family protein [Variovorax sp. J31P207]|uniref:phospholipase D family protein n=1 Tax=Variovorax sp. J31P207 TaxID=3053510 RepID=UPI00257570D8|nr:phospholipase D family protein [Variovorax sp. J31P207]MDM0070013.1 phospholipase D family protein [Variovorax sp. J31P207]
MQHALRCAAAWACCVLLALLTGCAGLPPLQDRPDTHALAPSEQTPLGRAIMPQSRQHPGKTGVVAVQDGRVAFGARVALVRNAARSIDIQTFIWHDDAAGTLLYEEVLRAAERGVRVRILLDDANTTRSIDSILALLASQPNVEVRLYNPFVSRGSKALGFITDFSRVNHRMHNKSFTVDNLVAVVGGRNIADEYFETGDRTGLVDLDVIAIGAVVGQVSNEFDLFWNSASAYPAKLILAGVQPQARDALAQRARAIREDPAAAKIVGAIANTEMVRNLMAGRLDTEWTTAAVINDDPSKTLDPPDLRGVELLPRLRAAFGRPTASLALISPYFVPGDPGTELLAELARSGVQVEVLTNSLAATDEMSVQSGYSKHRKALLRAGVQLYELRPEAAVITKRARETGRSSSAGLHAKTYAVDGRAIFVGSFNLDPRSAKLNTEMGLVIDSETMARNLAAVVQGSSPDLAYRLSLDDDGRILWHEGDRVYTVDPETGAFKRTLVLIGSWLPIDWLL